VRRALYESLMVDHNSSKPVPSLSRSIATGALGFGLVSLCIFATVAYAERWMYQTLGLLGAYVAWTVMFVLFGGAVFGSLVRWRLPRFYLLFGLAFFAYAVAWMIAYFTLRNDAGELIGSIAGPVAMAVVFAAGFRALRSTIKLSAVLFVSNFLGYYIGAAIYNSGMGRLGMVLWGVAYGVFFGAGIGAALHLVQRHRQNGTGTV
jgi:hypothetical protein